MRIKKVRCFKRKTKGDREAMTGYKNREAAIQSEPTIWNLVTRGTLFKRYSFIFSKVLSHTIHLLLMGTDITNILLQKTRAQRGQETSHRHTAELEHEFFPYYPQNSLAASCAHNQLLNSIPDTAQQRTETYGSLSWDQEHCLFVTKW